MSDGWVNITVREPVRDRAKADAGRLGVSMAVYIDDRLTESETLRARIAELEAGIVALPPWVACQTEELEETKQQLVDAYTERDIAHADRDRARNELAAIKDRGIDQRRSGPATAGSQRLLDPYAQDAGQ